MSHKKNKISKLIKKLSPLILLLEKYLAAFVLNLLYISLKYEIIGLEKPYPKGIYIFWHRNLLPLLINRKNENVAIIISSSKDGDFIAGPAKLYGYIPVRGSSSKQGVSALKEMLKLSKNHSIGLTPDGPKGPAQKIKNGAFQLAYLSKCPIYAVNVKVSKAWIFNSWDRFILPKPFSKVIVNYSKPYFIENKEQFDYYRNMIESFLNN
jgi:hypothetical protein